MSDVLDAKRRVGDAIDALKKPPAPERTYSAEEVREAFAEGIRYYCAKGGVGAADEARRRWPERKDGEAGKKEEDRE